jgi:SRSO17 transposase
VNLRQLAIAHAGQIQQVTWRQGTKAAKGNPDASMTGHFLAIRVRPANRDISRAEDGSLPDCWLLAEWPPAADEPTDYWLSNLPPGTPISELVRLAKIRWRAGHDYRELKTGLGLAHFEGRSFTGWHRHVTLAALAQAFCTLLRTGPKALHRDDPLPGPARTTDRARPHPRRLPLCCQAVTLDRLAAALTRT